MASNLNRRQSTRTSRVSRPSNYYAKPFSYRHALTAAPDILDDPDPPGFFPAVQYFTDATAALPREVQKHLTLLKETEGKAFIPSKSLATLLDAVERLPDPPRPTGALPAPGFLGFSTTNSVTGSANASIVDGVQPSLAIPTAGTSAIEPDPAASEREALHAQLQGTLREMIMILDEKNMVLTSANETLLRQTSLMDDVMPYIDEEISEDARLGSNTHWALPHMKDLRRATGTSALDRSRKDWQGGAALAAAAAAVHEGDIAATRSESRREAMLAKRSRHLHLDSDFDERQTSRKPAPSKSRKDKDFTGGEKSVATAVIAQKKRKAEKAGSVAMERSLSAAMNGRLASGGDQPNDRGEAARKKKPPPTQALATKKKNVTNSPSLAASPTRTTYSIMQKEQSPAPAMQRGGSSRGRQNSVQSSSHDPSRQTYRTSSATSSRKGLSNGLEPKKTGSSNGRVGGDNGSSLKDTVTYTDETPTPVNTATRDMLQQVGVNRSTAQSLKREEVDGTDEQVKTENGATQPGLSSQDSRQLRGSGRSSKPATPIHGPEDMKDAGREMPAASRPRSTRAINAAQPDQASSPLPSPQTSPRRAPRKAATASRKSSTENDAKVRDADEDNDENEPQYCFCGGPSYGDMVACDNEQCPHEWFHLECVGLTRPPTASKWYCSDDCRRQAARAR